MREAFAEQLPLGFVNIPEVKLNTTSRHELVPILRALQKIYSSKEQYETILKLIEKDILKGVSDITGKLGLRYWEILVLASVRLGCNLDYDALEDLANNHRKLREIMGLSFLSKCTFSRSCLQANLVKLAPATIAAISKELVGLGHDLEPNAAERVRVDSFVPETNIHFPTDANLIGDGIRKIILLVTALASILGVTGIAKSAYWLSKAKKLQRKIGTLMISKKESAKQELVDCYEEYIKLADMIIERALDFLALVDTSGLDVGVVLKVERSIDEIYMFLTGTAHMMELAHRRVLNGEKIPHDEKLFSLFEPHTEMINRGKTPYPWEFGHRIWVAEDKAGFIVDFDIMGIGQTDEKWTVEIAERIMKHYGDSKVQWLTFDRGFYTPLNRDWLKEIVPHFSLPKKGRTDKVQQELESVDGFKESRQKHSGIESAINGLDHCGLERCRDKGFTGYERYVSLAIMGRNLYTLGKILLRKDREELQKELYG